jgi:hypothetical protein
MPIRASAASLRQFPVVETHDPAIMQEMLVTQYGASRFEVHDATDFSGRMYYAPLGAVSLGVCAYSTPVSLEFPESGFVRLQIAIAGSAAMVIGNRATEISVAQAAITPAHRANRIDFGAGFQQLFVRIEIGALERKLVALLGARPRRPIEFSWALPDGQPHFRSFKEMIAFAARQLALTSANPPVLLLSQIEQALIAGFLETVPNSYSDALQRQPADIAATQVRRVEEYIDANWQQPITVEDRAASVESEPDRSSTPSSAPAATRRCPM